MNGHGTRLDHAIAALGQRHWLVSLLLISANAFYTLLFYRRMVYADQFDLVPLYRTFVEGGEWWREILEIHGGHWHAGGYLLMLPLARASDWSLLWEAVLSFSLLLLAWGTTVRLVRRTLEASAQAPVVLLTTLMFFSLAHSINLLWTWQLSLFLSVAAACVAIYALSRVDRTGWHLLVGLAATLIAVSAFATGFALWPVGLMMVALAPGLGVKRKCALLGAWILAGAIVTWMYASSGSTSGVLWSDIELSFVGGFVLTYLGAPLAYFSGRAAPVFGLIGFLSAVLLTFKARSLGAGMLVRLRPFYGLMLFALGCAVLSSVGRAEFSLDQARSPRYLIFAQFFWIGLCGVASHWAMMSSAGMASARLNAVGVLNLAVALAIALSLYNGQKIAKRQAAEAIRLNNAIADIRDHYPEIAPSTYELLAYPDRQHVRTSLATMHRYRINIFSRRGK